MADTEVKFAHENIKNRPLAILDDENPRAIINLVSNKMAAAIRKVPERWLTASEAQLHKELYKGKGSLDTYDVDERIRLSFWMEYTNAQDGERRIINKNIHNGIMHLTTFTEHFLKDVRRVAWMLAPPGNYEANMLALHKVLTNEMFAIASMPVREKRCILIGKNCPPDCDCPTIVNVKLADIKTKLHDKIDMRVKGAIVQRIDERRLNVNISAKSNESATNSVPPTMAEIDKRLAELERDTKLLGAGKTPSDSDIIEADYSPTEE